MDPRSKYATWVEVDLSAIEGNARALKASTKAHLMAVVKADGYGHGAIETARAAARGGATWIGVARADEALELRDSGIEEPVLILSPAPRDSLEPLVSRDISITVTDEKEIASAAQAAQARDSRARVHLKLDTGMSRIGARPQDAISLARSLNDHDEIVFEGLFTHLARADELEAATNQEQLELFEAALERLNALDMRPLIVHAANSAATIKNPKAHYDMVRVGIALYGLQPSRDWSLSEEFRPALEWKSQLTRVRDLPSGTGVSYGHDYVTLGEERIGTFPVGYGDGLRRMEGNQVLIDGELVPLVGRVCMDLSMVQLDAVPVAEPGDEVVLIGRQGSGEISAEQVGDQWGTINYEVTCAIGRRVPRLSRSSA